MSEQPVQPGRRHWRWLVLVLYAALLLGLAVAWHRPEWRHWMDPQALSALGRELLKTPLGPLAVVAGYVLAVMAGMPIVVLVSVGALIFPPWPGVAWCMLGTIVGAVVTYGIGRYASADTVEGWTQGKLAPLTRHLERRGLLTVITIRVLPLAPFIVMNLSSGALRVRLSDYVLGTFIGLIPAHIMLFYFVDSLSRAWQKPSAATFGALAACVLVVAGVFWWRKRKLGSAQRAG